MHTPRAPPSVAAPAQQQLARRACASDDRTSTARPAAAPGAAGGRPIWGDAESVRGHAGTSSRQTRLFGIRIGFLLFLPTLPSHFCHLNPPVPSSFIPLLFFAWFQYTLFRSSLYWQPLKPLFI